MQHLLLKKDGKTITLLPTEDGIELPPGDHELEAVPVAGRVIAKCEQVRRPHFNATFSLGMAGARGKVSLARGEEVRIKVTTDKAPPASEKKSDPEPGWVQLFNGKDLTGWKAHPKLAGAWSIEGGVLVGKDGLTYLLSDREYGDFHLRAELKTSGGTGIFFRASSAGENPRGWVADTATRTLQYADPQWQLVAGAAQSGPRVNDWFMLDIVAVGDRISIKVNGQAIIEHRNQRSANPKGLIALHAHTGAKLHFRKIEIKELPPEPSEWVQLFNGKDLTGWTGDTNVWTWKNDTLIGTKPRDGGIQMHSLRHQATWKDFELKFQASLDNQIGQAAVTVRGKEGMHIGPKKDIGSFFTDWGVVGKLTAATNQADLKKKPQGWLQ